MNNFLSQYQGGVSSAEAAAEFDPQELAEFSKIASANGVNLDAMSDEEMDVLWDAYKKTAEECSPAAAADDKKKKDDDEEEEPKEAAAKIAAENFTKEGAQAWGEYAGRTALLTFLGGLNEFNKEAGLGDRLKGVVTKVKDRLKGQKAESAAAAAAPRASAVQPSSASKATLGGGLASRAPSVSPGWSPSIAPKPTTKYPAGKAPSKAPSVSPGWNPGEKYPMSVKEKTRWDRMRDTISQTASDVAGSPTAKGIGLVTAGVAGGAGANALLSRKKDDGQSKQACDLSPVDELAIEYALVKAAEFGVSPEQTGDLLTQVFETGLVYQVNENTKTASVNSLDAVVHVRAMELLEAAGFPVDWNAQA